MYFQFKDIAEATAKALALRNDRIRYWNDIASKVNTAMSIANIMTFRDQYYGLIRYMIADQLTKGYHTYEDKWLGKICRNEIEECNKALADCACKGIEDEIMSQVAKIFSYQTV